MADILMIIHGVVLWIVLSFWCVLTFIPVSPEYQTRGMVWLWWITTVLVGVLASTFYVLQMR